MSNGIFCGKYVSSEEKMFLPPPANVLKFFQPFGIYFLAGFSKLFSPSPEEQIEQKFEL